MLEISHPAREEHHHLHRHTRRRRTLLLRCCAGHTSHQCHTQNMNLTQFHESFLSVRECHMDAVDEHKFPMGATCPLLDYPRPAPLLIACQALGIDPSGAWMVGDGQYDVEAGLAAGCRNV